MFDIFLDAALDSVKLFPFLFLAFLLLELFTHNSGKRNQKILVQFRKAGPLIGALLGCIPECGLPILGANLFSASLISPGTLLSVFLSSSDEAVLILLGMPEKSSIIPTLLVTKGIIAIIGGYLVDCFFGKYFEGKYLEVAEHTTHTEEDHHGCCHAGHSHNMLLHAGQHAVSLFFFIFLFNLALNVLLHLIGFSKLASLLLKNSIFQPVLAAVIGLIPNCAASVLLTELFGQGILSFASLLSGLCSTTGLGMFVLLKSCPDKKRVLYILAILFGISAIVGIIFSLLAL